LDKLFLCFAADIVLCVVVVVIVVVVVSVFADVAVVIVIVVAAAVVDFVMERRFCFYVLWFVARSLCKLQLQSLHFRASNRSLALQVSSSRDLIKTANACYRNPTVGGGGPIGIRLESKLKRVNNSTRYPNESGLWTLGIKQ